MFWVGDQGESTFPGCALYSHTLELLLAFPYDWENETILPGALRHFKRYQTCIVTFCIYYIAWILGDEERGENGDCSRSLVRTVNTGCETPQCAASWMLLLYARDSSRWLLTPGPHFLSRGGPDILAPGPGLQFPPSGTVWATHRLPCSVTSVVVRWAALRGKGVVPPWGDLCVLWHPSEEVDLAHRKVLCHFQAKWVISRTGQSSICERIHLTDDTSLCMRHLNRIWMVMQRFNTYEFAIIGRERL